MTRLRPDPRLPSSDVTRLTRKEWGMVLAALELLESEIGMGLDPSDLPESEARDMERELAELERLRQKVLERLH